MKKILTLFAFLPLIASAQKLTRAQQDSVDQIKQSMFGNIPAKDGKILYDSVVTVDTSLKKTILFTRIRQWFAENFFDSKSVLQVNDIDNGILTGKGVHKYALANGLSIHTGYTWFIMNVAVKDGKFRYQLYDFVSDDESTMLFSTSGPNTTTVQMNDVYQMQQQGKRGSYCRKYLGQMIDLVYLINTTLPAAVAKTSISDF